MPSIPFDGSKPFRLVPPATPARFSTGDTIVTRNSVTDAMPSTRATSKSSHSFRLVPPPAPEYPTTQKSIHQRAVTAYQKPIDEGEPATRSSAAVSSRHHAPSTSQFRLVPPPAPAQDMKSTTHYTVARPPTPEPFSLTLPPTAALVLEQGTTQQRAANTGVDDKQKFTRSSAAGSSRHHAATMPSTSQSFRLVPPPAPVQDKKSAPRFTVARPPTPDPFSLEIQAPSASSRVSAQETIQQRASDVGVDNYQKPIDVKALRASAKKAIKAQRLRVEQKHQVRANERYYFQHAEVDWETPLSRQELEETLTISLARAVKKAGRTFRKATRLEIAQMVDIKLRSREQARSAASESRRPLPEVPASSKSTTVPKVKPSPLLDALGFPEDILEMLALSKAVRPERLAILQTISAQRPIYEFRDRENGIEEPETSPVEQALGRLLPALLPGEVSLVLEMMSIARAELFQLAMQHEDEYGDDSMEEADVQIS